MERNLIQARYLFEKARLVWEPYRELTNGLAVGLLQDSAELTVWAIAKKYGVGQPKDFFVDLIKKLDGAGHRISAALHIDEVNRARVNYKHAGLLPSTSDVPKLIEGTHFFLRENVRDHFGLDFDAISLADDVRDDEIRCCLKEAERFRDTGDLEEALVQASLAMQHTVVQALTLNAHFGSLPELGNAYSLFPEEAQSDARILLHDFERYFQSLSVCIAMLSLKVDRSLYEDLERRRLTVNVSMLGNRLGVVKHEKSEASLENVNFLISNVTEIALRL